jgi:murein DD-endopeptidase MepM/ murein hydrolase activator NlpD
MRNAAIAAALAAAAIASPPPAGAANFSLQSSSVNPQQAFFDAEGGIRIAYRFSASGPTDVSVRVVGAGGDVRVLALPQQQPGVEQEVVWDGLTSAGKAAPDGSYRVLVGEAGMPETEAGRLTLRGHRYPVLGPHSFRGAVGEFGAGRNGGRIHEGFDINAACGKPMVAARGGTVIRRRFDGRLDGNFIVIRGFKENRTYRYSHLISPAPVSRGDHVSTGQLVGRVGKTGNARSVGCHLHFEIRRRGRFIDPEPELRRWDRFS